MSRLRIWGMIGLMLIVWLYLPTQLTSAALTRCENRNFRGALESKAAENKWLGAMIEGPFAIGGVDYKSTVGIGDKRTIPAGCFSRYQNGMIYISSRTKAQIVQGAIANKWIKLDWEKGPLGYPISDELKTPDGKGRVSHFQFGSIYWHPDVGAFGVWGAIAELYNRWKATESIAGYPITDESDWHKQAASNAGGESRLSRFQGADIFWSPKHGAIGIWGYLRECYWRVYRNVKADQLLYLIPRRVSLVDRAGNAGTIYFENTATGTQQRVEANKSVGHCSGYFTPR